jgi:hypothetical protein
MLSLIVFASLLTGAGLLLALTLHQVTARNPLMPMKQLLSTFPIAAVTIAVSAGAASIALIELAQTALSTRDTPAHLGTLFFAELGGAVLTAFLFGALVRTRFVPLLAWLGLVALAGGAAVLSGVATGSNSLVIVGSGLVGLGLGASVAPALFTTGFSLRAGQLQRVFAMLELLRGAAAFAAATHQTGGSRAAGIQNGVWVCFAIIATGAAISLYVFILGRGRLQVPDIARWEQGGGPAWDSPPLAAGIRAPVLRADAGNGVVDPSSGEAARVEALARASRIARGAD